MLLRDIISPHDKIFLKSEWGPISDEWPALSFTHGKVGRRLQAEMDPSRDIVIYVGTSDPRSTRDESHRRRLLSVLRVEPKQPRATEDLVPREIWLASQREFGVRFQTSFPVTKAWQFDSFPLASDLIPEAYRKLGEIRYRGDVVELTADERATLMDFTISEVPLPENAVIDRIHDFAKVRDLSQEEKRAVSRMERFITAPDDPVNGDIARMVASIKGRVAGGGTVKSHDMPLRYTDVNTNLVILLTKMWHEQKKRCALCMGLMIPNAINPLLQPSPDRKNSSNPNYDEHNLSITHLGCNLAKNKFSVDQFEEWMDVLRGVDGVDIDALRVEG